MWIPNLPSSLMFSWFQVCTESNVLYGQEMFVDTHPWFCVLILYFHGECLVGKNTMEYETWLEIPNRWCHFGTRSLEKAWDPLEKTRGSKSSVEVSSILARQGPVKFDGLWWRGNLPSISSMMFERFDVEKIRGMGWKPCPRWVFYQKKNQPNRRPLDMV